jgi:phage tail-like protein
MPIGEDAIANYAYQLEIGGRPIAQFKEVSGLSSEVQVIEHKENKAGGIPVLHKLPGWRKDGDITLKHGVTKDTMMWKWIKEVHDGKIDSARSDGSVVLYDYERGEILRFNFFKAWPTKVSIGSLQAGGSEILIQECVLAHEGLELA